VKNYYRKDSWYKTEPRVGDIIIELTCIAKAWGTERAAVLRASLA